MLTGTKVVALLEPIGFRHVLDEVPGEAATAIERLDLGHRFGIVHDTFQHALAKDPEILASHVRMVHVSGVSGGTGDLTDAQDAERDLLDASDRTDALSQLRNLFAAGYRGPLSFECTAPALRDRNDLQAPIAASINYLRRQLGPLDLCDRRSPR